MPAGAAEEVEAEVAGEAPIDLIHYSVCTVVVDIFLAVRILCIEKASIIIYLYPLSLQCYTLFNNNK